MAVSTHFKLGLFTLAALVALVVTGLALGLSTMQKESAELHVYFDESVDGLEVGAPVKYRGVDVGTVSAIRIAPDQRHVEVVVSIERTRAERLSLAPAKGAGRFAPPEALRAQLASQGITGVKFVNLDFFETAPPPEALAFETAELTIPAVPSFLKLLEDGALRTLDRLPTVIEPLGKSLAGIDAFVESLRKQALPERVAKVVDDVDHAVAMVKGILRQIDVAHLPAGLAVALDNVNRSLKTLRGLVDSVSGQDGLLDSAKRATDSVGDLGRDTNARTVELDRTLRDVSEMARAIRDLAEALERDPDMLLKGKAEQREP